MWVIYDVSKSLSLNLTCAICLFNIICHVGHWSTFDVIYVYYNKVGNKMRDYLRNDICNSGGSRKFQEMGVIIFELKYAFSY